MNIENILKESISFYNDLSKEDKVKLIANSYIKEYKTDEIIISKEKDCLGIILILSGELRAYMSSNIGKEITLYRLYDMDTCILSSSCVYQNLNVDVELQSIKNSKILIMDGKVLKEISQRNVHINNFILNITQNRLSEIMWVLEQVVFLNLDNRLSSFLLNEYYTNNSNTISVTHDTIANNLGSAREVISRMLKRFEKEGIVKLSRGSIELVDINKLNEMSNQTK